MEIPEIEVNGFYAKDGLRLVMEQWDSTIGRAECAKTARQIIENNPDKGQLADYITDILMGIEYLKFQNARRS